MANIGPLECAIFLIPVVGIAVCVFVLVKLAGKRRQQ